MKNLIPLVALLISFLLIGASVYIVVTQPQNKEAWGWLMALGFFLSLSALGSIEK